MEAFGIRFKVTDPPLFQSVRALFYEVKKDKDAEAFRNPDEWVRLVPDEVKPKFHWPPAEARAEWLARRDFTPIAIPQPAHQLSARWDFYRVFESLEGGEYSLLSCEMVGPDTAEMHIDPEAYPYGGLGPMIALAEAYGFVVLGVNEYGKYESREDLLQRRSEGRT
jgi:hypothetical protein